MQLAPPPMAESWTEWTTAPSSLQRNVSFCRQVIGKRHVPVRRCFSATVPRVVLQKYPRPSTPASNARVISPTMIIFDTSGARYQRGEDEMNAEPAKHMSYRRRAGRSAGATAQRALRVRFVSDDGERRAYARW